MNRMKRYRKLLHLRSLRRLRGAWVVAVGGVIVHLTAASAWAQKPGRVADEDSGLIQWVIAGALAILICLPAFINPKRSHLT